MVEMGLRENDDGNYPIARDAVDIIASLKTVPDDVLGDLSKRRGARNISVS